MKVAKTKHPPEQFFRDVGKEKKEGMVFLNDERLSYWETLPNGKGKWCPNYAYPTDLAKYIASTYPMGITISSIKVIQRSNGQLLTILHKDCGNGFIVDVWGGLTDPVNKEEQK